MLLDVFLTTLLPLLPFLHVSPVSSNQSATVLFPLQPQVKQAVHPAIRKRGKPIAYQQIIQWLLVPEDDPLFDVVFELLVEFLDCEGLLPDIAIRSVIVGELEIYLSSITEFVVVLACRVTQDQCLVHLPQNTPIGQWRATYPLPLLAVLDALEWCDMVPGLRLGN